MEPWQLEAAKKLARPGHWTSRIERLVDLEERVEHLRRDISNTQVLATSLSGRYEERNEELKKHSHHYDRTVFRGDALNGRVGKNDTILGGGAYGQALSEAEDGERHEWWDSVYIMLLPQPRNETLYTKPRVKEQETSPPVYEGLEETWQERLKKQLSKDRDHW